jgi:hypothetical protein
MWERGRLEAGRAGSSRTVRCSSWQRLYLGDRFHVLRLTPVEEFRARHACIADVKGEEFPNAGQGAGHQGRERAQKEGR